MKQKDVTCEECGWSWDIEPEDQHPYLCHQCGHTNKKVQNENLRYLLQMKRKSIILEQSRDEIELFKLSNSYYKKNGKENTIKVLEHIIKVISKSYSKLFNPMPHSKTHKRSTKTTRVPTIVKFTRTN